MNKYFEYLLSDEMNGISSADYEERKLIVEELESEVDGNILSKIRHFQPQIGCLNACSICSKRASSNISWWNTNRLRNVIAAIKHIALKYRSELPYISWDRTNHRSGVVFSYLDNDIGNYYYLNEFIHLMYEELGVTTRISTVGYSRHNELLNQMHSDINKGENLKKLGGFRISFTPYAIGWKCNNKNYSRFDYIMDMANILQTYKPYYNYAGPGSRKMCVELRYKPLVILGKVYEKEIDGHKVIAANHHVYVSKEKNVSLKTSYIANPYNHNIELSEQPEYFYDISSHYIIESFVQVKNIVNSFLYETNDENKNKMKVVPVYKLENAEGHYYSIDPSISDDGNYGINIYPITENRINSGVVITERFALNAILQVKKEQSIGSLEKFEKAIWQDAYRVLDKINMMAANYKENGELEKAEYILSEVVEMLEGYIYALQQAGYSAKDFFDPEFSIDTGIICNMGGALKEFKGITFLENEPLTPTHERNYGKHNSTMTMENEVFRISCEYNNQLIIQKLNLSNTATRDGQVAFSKIIQLAELDETYNMTNLELEYFIPGQRRKQ